MKKINILINQFLNKFGYKISKFNNTDDLIKIFKYKDYQEYKKTQIHYNKNKIKYIFSDENTLNGIYEYIIKKLPKENLKGICHGSRNGFEIHFFNKVFSKSEIIGTDISNNATNFKNSLVHDFHESKEEWISHFDFVYSNSLDQSYDPKKAVKTWFDQIKINRYLFIELTDQHTVQTSSKMDPFGIETYFFPYLLVEWFGSKISIEIIKNIKSNKMRERKVDMGEVIDGASFVAEGLTSYVFIVKKLND